MDQQTTRDLISRTEHLIDLAQTVVRQWRRIRDSERAKDALLIRRQPIGPATQPHWRILPLTSADDALVNEIAGAEALPEASAQLRRTVDQLTDPRMGHQVKAAKATVGLRRFFASGARKSAGAEAATWLQQWHVGLAQHDCTSELEQLASWRPPTVDAGAILAPQVGFAADLGDGATLYTAPQLQLVTAAAQTLERLLADERQVRETVARAAKQVQRDEATSLVAQLPVDRLKDATSGHLRLNALKRAGFYTVDQVLAAGQRVLALPGMGPTTGTRTVAAAQALWQATLDDARLRLDPHHPTPAGTTLLQALGRWEEVRTAVPASADDETRAVAEQLLAASRQQARWAVVVPQARPIADFEAALTRLSSYAGGVWAAPQRTKRAATDPWDDFRARPADYYAMLSQLGLMAEQESARTGDLPAEIVDEIRNLRLDTTHLTASLRGYQSFAARFALVQRRVIIGDEMGLGKTVEALAACAHLYAQGAQHFLVVCPAAVVTNWVREVSAKSNLPARRLHGSSRDAELRRWIRQGGVAVTTYESLSWLEREGIPAGAEPVCLVVDEAHYIKNPAAVRTSKTRELIRRSGHVILLTGTPLENRIDEFRNLVGYVRPDLVVNASELAPVQFRREVAPAYLRRNQEDVLSELPELVEVDEWMPLSPADEEHYRRAVEAGNFMAMRQAAMRAGAESEKLQRLLDIVEEAEDNDRRVLVFSNFLSVLDAVVGILPGRVFGPLTGSVSPDERQRMVDEFSQAPHGAVLVAQIVAGGVGLNIQAASVVVICEPQLKPTTEWQAIARARRMGQLESVQVHRLLSEDAVDERITDILERKSGLFSQFARISDTAGSAPEAFDISDAQLAREIVAAERARLIGSSAQSGWSGA
ncbi:DEAD/DEAH box helicase [Aestuariimicrobium soli]|uniref:DEAD/DEAH box helicase n=1 Tax=Aestuariimicrobium soli TaxID=2035834 RepID=UPI003EB9AA76